METMERKQPRRRRSFTPEFKAEIVGDIPRVPAASATCSGGGAGEQRPVHADRLPASQPLGRYGHQRQLFELVLRLVLVQECRLPVKPAADYVIHELLSEHSPQSAPGHREQIWFRAPPVRRNGRFNGDTYLAVQRVREFVVELADVLKNSDDLSRCGDPAQYLRTDALGNNVLLDGAQPIAGSD